MKATADALIAAIEEEGLTFEAFEAFESNSAKDVRVDGKWTRDESQPPVTIADWLRRQEAAGKDLRDRVETLSMWFGDSGSLNKDGQKLVCENELNLLLDLIDELEK